MTPEEKAVIEAARGWKLAASGIDQDEAETVLWRALEALDSPQPQWHPATFADCLAGDRIRIGDQESDVLWTTGPQQFHARNREWIDDAGKVRDHQTPWEHIEVRMDLSANPGRREYVPSTPCEILCTPERAAALILNAKPVDK
jgi:hypothetical protein